MGIKRNKTQIIITSVISFLMLVICLQPFLHLKEGTFLWASLSGLFGFFSQYVGYFSTDLQQFSLVPVTLFFITLLVDSVLANSVFIICLHSVSFVSLLIFMRMIQGSFFNLSPWFFSFSLVAFGISLMLIAFEKVRCYLKDRDDFAQRESFLDKSAFARESKKLRKSKKSGDAELLSDDFTDEDQERRRIMSISVQKARELITSTVIPDFAAFPMVPIHDDSATLGGSVDTSIFSAIKLENEILSKNKASRPKVEFSPEVASIFETKNLDRKAEEEKEAKEVFRKQSFAPTTQLDEQFQSYASPVDYGQKETIVDVGTPENEDEYEKILEETSSSEDDIDYVSGVAGLSSGAEGRKSYLINADKYRYRFPSSSLLKHYPVSARSYADMEHDPDGITIVDTLRQFRIETQLMAVQHGPTFTLYELQLAPGIRVNSVQNFADNIAMNLAVSGVRILAPIPGKIAIGIEVPNKNRDTIGFDVMYQSLTAKQLKIPFVLGKTITGDSIVIDLAGTPHLLVAGTTGSGKSVCVNSLICSVLYSKTPQEVRMILVDPKMVELSLYNGIPHLLTPVITQPKRAIKAMEFVIGEMERRMQIFKSCGAKKIEDYNKKIEEKSILAVKLPYIMVIIDEFADLMMVVGKELEAYIQRITQVARFTGIHLVLATQRPSVDVITGIIKSNIPSRIAFAVSDATNSKIIIDRGGAEKLLGRGDMLYLGSTSPEPMRIQGAYIDPEIEDIVAAVKRNGEPDYIDESYFEDDEDDDSAEDVSDSSSGGEDMFTKAWKIVSDRGEASASYLQRKLNIGYNRAATLIEKLEDAGYIGPARGSKPREIMRKYIPQEFDD